MKRCFCLKEAVCNTKEEETNTERLLLCSSCQRLGCGEASCNRRLEILSSSI